MKLSPYFGSIFNCAKVYWNKALPCDFLSRSTLSCPIVIVLLTDIVVRYERNVLVSQMHLYVLFKTKELVVRNEFSYLDERNVARNDDATAIWWSAGKSEAKEGEWITEKRKSGFLSSVPLNPATGWRGEGQKTRRTSGGKAAHNSEGWSGWELQKDRTSRRGWTLKFHRKHLTPGERDQPREWPGTIVIYSNRRHSSG